MATDKKLQQFKRDIANACHITVSQLNRLRAIEIRLNSGEKDMLYQVAECMQRRDSWHAQIIANEISSVRRLQKVTGQMGLQLEAMVIRLSTLTEFVNLVETIDPVADMFRGIENDIKSVSSGTNTMVSDMSTVAANILSLTNLDTCERKVRGVSHTEMDEATMSVLKEVEQKIEQEVQAKLPKAPLDNEGLVIIAMTNEKEKEQRSEVNNEQLLA